MRRRDPRSGSLLLMVIALGLLLTGFGAALLGPTDAAARRARTSQARLEARQAALSGLAAALEAVGSKRDFPEGAGLLGHARFTYRIEPHDGGELRIVVAGIAASSRHEVEAHLDTIVRLPETGPPTHHSWKLHVRRRKP